MLQTPRVAIVSDPLVQRGGAERVVEVFARLFPAAPIFAVLYSSSTGPASIANRVVRSFLNRIPLATRFHRWLFPLYPQAIESFDLSGFDIILSSHHSVAKNVLRGAHQYHVTYCHTPMRTLWEPAVEARRIPKLARPVLEIVAHYLRIWDYAGAGRVDLFIANSETTKRRIAKHYGRDAVVLNPPIDVERFTPGSGSRGEYYLLASRLMPYKRVDLAVAATGVAGRRLVVVGGGTPSPDMIQPHVEFRGHVSDEELIGLMRGARAMIFPAFEDFGMAPVEMMACGGPVIALNRGGTRETVIDGVTGVLATAQTVEAFVAAIRHFESLTLDALRIRRHAERYSQAAFMQRLSEIIEDGYNALSENSGVGTPRG